jgi:hypothetical protein
MYYCHEWSKSMDGVGPGNEGEYPVADGSTGADYQEMIGGVASTPEFSARFNEWTGDATCSTLPAEQRDWRPCQNGWVDSTHGSTYDMCGGLKGADGACYPWEGGAGGLDKAGMPLDNDSWGEPEARKKATAIVEYFHKKQGWENPACYVVNTGDDVVVRQDDENPTLRLDARMCPADTKPTFIVAGAFDASLSIEEMFSQTFSFYLLGGENNIAEVSFTMDIETDLSELGGGWAPKKADDYPDKRKRVYHTTSSSAPITRTQGCGDLHLMYTVGELALCQKPFIAEEGPSGLTSGLNHGSRLCLREQEASLAVTS